MSNLQMIITGVLGVVAIPALRAAIKAYREKKEAGEILVEAIEAALDEVEGKDK